MLGVGALEGDSAVSGTACPSGGGGEVARGDDGQEDGDANGVGGAEPLEPSPGITSAMPDSRRT